MNQSPLVSRGIKIIAGDTTFTVMKICRDGVLCQIGDGPSTVKMGFKAIEMAAS